MQKTHSKHAGVVATDAEPPSELTATEAEAVAAFKTAQTTSGPRLQVELDARDKVRLGVDHPDQAIGMLALMRAIGTTDVEFYSGLIGQFANTSKEQNALSQNGTNFMLSVVKGIQPRDQIEAVLGAQMAAVHVASMTFARRLAHVEKFPQQDHRAASNSVLERPSLQAEA